MKGIILIVIVVLVIFLAWYMMQQNGNGDDNSDDIEPDIPPEDIPPELYNHIDVKGLWPAFTMVYFDQLELKVKTVWDTLEGKTPEDNAQLKLTVMSASGRITYMQYQSGLIQIERFL